MRLRTAVFAIGGIVVVGGIAAATYLMVSNSGWKTSICDVTATREPSAPEDSVVLPPSLIEAHPALREALEEAGRDEIGHGRFASCEERDDVASGIERAGASIDAEEGGYLVAVNESSYRVTLRRAVA